MAITNRDELKVAKKETKELLKTKPKVAYDKKVLQAILDAITKIEERLDFLEQGHGNK